MRTLLITLLFACTLAAVGLAAGVGFQEIEESLTCQCGCGLTVHSCNHLQCGSAIPLREEIRNKIAGGLSKDAILAYFANKYGEKILSAPTHHGFNVTAWVTPFAVLALGALFVVWTLRRWHKPAAAAPGTAAAQPPATAQFREHEALFEDELKRFDE